MKPGRLLAVTLATSLFGVSSPLLAEDEAPSYFDISPYAQTPSYAGKATDLMHLDNGMILEGGGLETPDGYTSGFRLTAGFSPLNLPQLDLGAEFTYRESDEVPTRHGDQPLILNTTSLGGSLVAGVRLGQLGLYAKSGFTEWEGDPVTRSEGMLIATTGTARVQGFGARLQHNRLVSRLEFEEFDAPSMAHLNLITASLHYPF
ncbi:hypothetical protein [Billgrantia endophytica]|uniref:Outer membrane protein beta-barrel domain-containing protein n=1 Tax=Billgrantia endophytica TaxID=2033802 RepID=A0A2N7TZ48_9GAMM|nr:hypothetical protein [Halomonas endophytica]PMR73456.1 hypothetical protein C1H69_17165 [Halomonas endophytica]